MLRKRGGRGGGRGRRGIGKRPLAQTHPIRPVAPVTSRLPVAALGNHGENGESESSESFRMVSGGGPFDFGTIIRLVPGLVEEIKNAEERGGRVRVKFDSNYNDPSANVIGVDGKEFRFTWSRDFGDLCDIYQEHQKCEEGYGLLNECGSAWRKLNVQRVLDESAKQNLKMKSEEAERLHNSRTTIVLNPKNSSILNQFTTPNEGNTRTMHRSKEPPYKKKNTKPGLNLCLGSKPVIKSRTSLSHTCIGGMVPLPPPPLTKPDSNGSALPYGDGDSVKRNEITDSGVLLLSNKENAANYMIGKKNDAAYRVSHKIVHKEASSESVDLQTLLITLLSKNPKGMSLKSLERFVMETMPKPVLLIESIIQNIANFKAPGKYFLKPEVGIESFKQHPLESKRSSEDNTGRNSTVQLFSESHLCSRAKKDSSSPIKLNLQKVSPDPFIDRYTSKDNEGREYSSSSSESESGSESSDTSDDVSDGSSSSNGTDVEDDREIDDVIGGIGKETRAEEIIFSDSRRMGEFDGIRQKNEVDVDGGAVSKGQDIEIIHASHINRNMENNTREFHPMTRSCSLIEQCKIQKDVGQASQSYNGRVENLASQTPNFRGVELVASKSHASIAHVDDTSHDGQVGLIAIPGSKRKNSLLSTDHRNDIFIEDSNSKRPKFSSSPDMSFFLNFDKDVPAPCGPIKNYCQYNEFVIKYEEKYKLYIALNEHIESTRVAFLKIAGDLPELEKGGDKEAYNNRCEDIFKFHKQHKKIYTALKNRFKIIYEESEVLKQRIKDFAEEYTKRV